jgi:hypothetical protein
MLKRNAATGRVMLVLASTLLSLAGVELALRASYGRQRHLDYADVCRTDGLGPGRFLRESFDGYVEDGFGGTVRWANNSQGTCIGTHGDTPP